VQNRYFLDTCIIRNFAVGDLRCEALCDMMSEGEVFVPAICIFEFLADINERNFDYIKKSCVFIRKNKLIIAADPESYLSSGYINGNRQNDIEMWSQYLLHIENSHNINELSVLIDLQALRNEFKKKKTCFVYKIYKKLYKYSGGDDYWNPDKSKRTNKKPQYDKTEKDDVRGSLDTCLRRGIPKRFNGLLESETNAKLEFYYAMITEYVVSFLENGRRPKDNDYFDTEYWLYSTTDYEIVVTEDQWATMAKKVDYNQRVIGMKELK